MDAVAGIPFAVSFAPVVEKTDGTGAKGMCVEAVMLAS